MKKNIGILYIATGRYTIFWEAFYKSMQQYFIPNYTKQYYVFTDAPTIYDSNNNTNIILINDHAKGWPYDTLMRFHTFEKAKPYWSNCEFLFFFNANMLVMQTITDVEFLPNGNTDDGLLATLHPGFYNSPRATYTYEQLQTNSTAYIPSNQGLYYFMGGLNGGTLQAYTSLIASLKANVTTDINNNIIALWHDESHLNKYLLNKNPKIVTAAYGYPEGAKLPLEKIILIRDKNKYGGHAYLRNQQEKINTWDIVKTKVKYYLKKLIN